MCRDYKIYLEDILLRNVLIHEYPGIDLETIWDIIENKLSSFEKQVKEILRG
jgi:uncharacterized protein with HEPN domain